MKYCMRLDHRRSLRPGVKHPNRHQACMRNDADVPIVASEIIWWSLALSTFCVSLEVTAVRLLEVFFAMIYDEDITYYLYDNTNTSIVEVLENLPSVKLCLRCA